VHVPDLRGRGATDRAGPGRYRLSDYAADVAVLGQELHLQAPAVLGHSMGARIATAWAVVHAGTGHGQLVLVDPPMSGPGRDPYPTTREQFLAQLGQAQRGTTADEVRAFHPLWTDRELQLRAEALASCDQTAVIESHAGFETENILDLYRRLTGPAVVVRGAESSVVPPAAAEDLRRANPAIDVITVPSAGHMVPWDNERGFFKAVGPYLSGGSLTDARDTDERT